jgi:CRP-like cAMP-binding protein
MYASCLNFSLPFTCPQESFSAGQVVWQERDTTSSKFFIIREGTANLKDAGTGAITSKLGPGKYFGQQSLVGSGQSGRQHLLQGQGHSLSSSLAAAAA